MVMEAASKTSDQAGDGTTTATILAGAIKLKILGAREALGGFVLITAHKRPDRSCLALVAEGRAAAKPRTIVISDKEIDPVRL
jgi:chaperonin GroEL